MTVDHASGDGTIAVIVDGYTSRAVIAAYMEAGITVYTSSHPYSDPSTIELKYREPVRPARMKQERHWIQQHPRSPGKRQRR